MLAPFIPGLTDHELPSLIEAVAAAGAESAGMILLRLPLTVQPVFLDWLQTHAPEKREKIESLIRSTRGGQLNQSQFGQRFRGTGAIADQIHRPSESSPKSPNSTDRGLLWTTVSSNPLSRSQGSCGSSDLILATVAMVDAAELASARNQFQSKLSRVDVVPAGAVVALYVTVRRDFGLAWRRAAVGAFEFSGLGRSAGG